MSEAAALAPGRADGPAEGPAHGQADGLAHGQVVEVEVGAVAHGGHCIARHEGQVLFVRHTAPGERVRAVVTEVGPGARFVRADTVEVLDASPARVPPPCIYAGRCGGCDFQHLTLAHQRALKTAVVREQFARLAHLDVDVVVEPLPGSTDGLGWRTRVEYALDADGRPGLHPHRSHAVLPIDRCLLASPGVARTDALHRLWPNRSAVDVVAPAVGSAVTIAVPSEMPGPVVTERVAARWGPEPHSFGHDFRVGARGFWQVHPAAASTLVAAVLAGLGPRPGERALDLYAGVGVFAAALADRVGPTGQVIAVESDADAVACGRENLADWPWALMVQGRVDDAFGVAARPRRGAGSRRGRARGGASAGGSTGGRAPLMPESADLVVLDPPRTGAGRGVAAAVAALGPRAAAYVACDPAALARDTAFLREQGYGLAALTAYDAFPMTHHVECVAVFRPVEDS